MNRRAFLQSSSAALAATQTAPAKPVRVGVLGTGNRGTSLIRRMLELGEAAIRAVYDPNPEAQARAQDLVASQGQPKPEGYRGDAASEVWKRLVERDDLDAVIIASPWEYHAPQAVYAMRAGKYPGVEVPVAQTVAQCWELVRTSEETGVPCMMLENWSFRRDNLAVLKMIRAGLLGEIVHCHCAHGNDCVGRTPWYFDRQGNPRWSGYYLIGRNCDQYPTHSLGPVLSWMNIGCGDAFDYVVSMASRSLGINSFFTKTLGPDHPAARRHYSQGDIVTSLIKTKKGNTIVVNNDMQLPAPYDNRWRIQGTEGLYCEERNAIYLWRRSPKEHEWEPFPPYQEKYEHEWWKPVSRPGGPAADQLAQGHGGTDHQVLRHFLRAVRGRRQTPIDVYDSVNMSVLIPLSQQSIAQGGQPVKFPDFTGGRWATRKPEFALEAQG